MKGKSSLHASLMAFGIALPLTVLPARLSAQQAANAGIDIGDNGSVDPFVLGWIERLVRLDVVVPFAVGIGIRDERRPPLRFLLVPRLLEHFAV